MLIIRYGVYNLKMHRKLSDQNGIRGFDRAKDQAIIDDLDDVVEGFADSLEAWEQIFAEMAR